jgi:hypothetical protein
LNEINRKFFDFITRFFQGITFDAKDNRIKNKYNKEEMTTFIEELKSLVGANSFDQSKALSFFTFDQQLENYRYRPINQDFSKNYDFVFSGCSQTHGDHITEPKVKGGCYKDIWGFQIADTYGKEALNLGMGGWGAESILKGLMHHFQKNGNPKVLLVLYPDLGRIEGVDSNKIKMRSPLNTHELIQHWFLRPSDDHKVNKVSALPHSPLDVIPFTQALYKNLQSILLLNEYCKQNNIYFKYSSWHHTTNAFLKMLKESFSEYSNYSEPKEFNLDEVAFENLNCHKDIKEDKIEKVWNIGHDKEHMGIHQHIHIAEQFKRDLDNDNPWN